MIDLKAARSEPERVRAALARKGAAEAFDRLLAADERWRKGIVEMMQDAARFDDVEFAGEIRKLHDVGLREFQPAEIAVARMATGISETGGADIDRENIRIAIGQGGFQRLQAGTASGDQDFR